MAHCTNTSLELSSLYLLLLSHSSTMLTSNSKEKERSLSYLCCWYLGRRRVAMLLLLSLAVIVFVMGAYTINKESNSRNTHQSIETMNFGSNQTLISRELTSFYIGNSNNDHIRDSFMWNGIRGSDVDIIHPPPSLPVHHHPCDSFSFPPSPPPGLKWPGLKRPGPRQEALAHMPKLPFESHMHKNLTYVHEESPIKPEGSQGGSEFGGSPSLEQRTKSFDIKEYMTLHCGFVEGTKPGQQTGYDIDEDILLELDQSHAVIVALAIFGRRKFLCDIYCLHSEEQKISIFCYFFSRKYDINQEPVNISEMATENIPFYMFVVIVDEETHLYLKNTSSYTDDNKRVGLWRIIVDLLSIMSLTPMQGVMES